MTREKFLDELRKTLSGLKAEELNSVVSYYTEMIDDRIETGMSEEEAIAVMEPVSVIAEQVLKEYPQEKSRESGVDIEKLITYDAASIREIRIRTSNQRVKVIPHESEQITLRYTKTSHDEYHVTCENGVLTLVREPVRNIQFIFFNFGFSTNTNAIEVKVPKEYAGNIDLDTSNSSISIDDFACWGKVLAHTSNSKIAVSNHKAKSLSLKTSNSKIELMDVQAQNDLIAETNNSRISAESVTAGKQLSLVTTNGHITVTKLLAPDINLHSSNSGISGSISGRQKEYSINSGTCNAHSNLPSRTTDGEKHLSIHTSNGGIQVVFTDEQ